MRFFQTGLVVGLAAIAVLFGAADAQAIATKTGHCVIANFTEDGAGIAKFGGCYDFTYVGDVDSYAGNCENLSNAYASVVEEGSFKSDSQCSGKPDSKLVPFLTEWNSKHFCVYEKVALNSPVEGCLAFTGGAKGQCLTVPGYSSTSFLGTDAAGVCPTNNSPAFKQASEKAAENEKNLAGDVKEVSDDIQCCIQYNGDFAQTNVTSCSAAEKINQKNACDTSLGSKLKTTTDACSSVDICKVQDQCCVVFQDKNKDGTYQDGEEVNQCHPATAGCGEIFYSSTEDAGSGGVTTAKIVGQKCGQVTACGGKTLSVDAALSKKNTNIEKANEPAAPDNPKVWTKAACEKAGHVWSPPENNKGATSGNYCFVLADTDLNVEVGGVSKATIVEFIPLLFNYGFVLLGVASILSLVFAGAQAAAAAGNAAAVAGAKSMMVASFVAMGTAAGGYTLLNTVSPQTVALQPPAIQAVIGADADLNKKYTPGSDQLCCNTKGYCAMVRVPGGLSEEQLKTFAKECKSYSDYGFFCKEQGPLADACAKSGGECSIGMASDPKTAGACSQVLQTYVFPGLESAKNIAFSFLATPLFVGDMGLQFLTNGQWTIDPVQATKNIQNDWEAGLPGTGQVGICKKAKVNLKDGETCSSNSQCASKKCVRDEWTASCFVAKELGTCSSGEVGQDCHPQNNTLLDGVNVFTDKFATCKSGLECKLSVESGLIGAGHRYACSDGSLASACGDFLMTCTEFRLQKLVKEFNKKLKEHEELAEDKNIRKEFADANFYIPQLAGSAAAAVGGQKVYAMTEKSVSALTTIGQVFPVVYTAIEVFNFSDESDRVALKFLTAQIENLRTQIQETSGTILDECDVDNIKTGSICKSGLSCQEKSNPDGFVGGTLHVCLSGKEIQEGTACVLKDPIVKICDGIGANAYDCYEAPEGTTQHAQGGGYCSKQDSKLNGFSGRLAYNSHCTFGSSEAISAAGSGDYSFAPVGCTGVLPTGSYIEKNKSGSYLGHPVCYKAISASSYGRCGWYAPVDQQKILKYPVSSAGNVYLADDEDSGKSVAIAHKNIGSPCVRAGSVLVAGDAKNRFPSPQCGGALSNMDTILGNYLEAKLSKGNLEDGTSILQHAMDNAWAEPMCMTKSADTQIGECVVSIEFTTNSSILIDKSPLKDQIITFTKETIQKYK